MNADGSSRRIDVILFYIVEPSEPNKVPVIAEGILVGISRMDAWMNAGWLIKL